MICRFGELCYSGAFNILNHRILLYEEEFVTRHLYITATWYCWGLEPLLV